MIEDGPIDTSALDDADPPITNETPILSEDAPASEDPFERPAGRLIGRRCNKRTTAIRRSPNSTSA